MISRAPELSATLRRLNFWIIAPAPRSRPRCLQPSRRRQPAALLLQGLLLGWPLLLQGPPLPGQPPQRLLEPPLPELPGPPPPTPLRQERQRPGQPLRRQPA